MAGRLSKGDNARLKAWLEVLGLCLSSLADELRRLGVETDETLLSLSTIRNQLNWLDQFVKKG